MASKVQMELKWILRGVDGRRGFMKWWVGMTCRYENWLKAVGKRRGLRATGWQSAAAGGEAWAAMKKKRLVSAKRNDMLLTFER